MTDLIYNKDEIAQYANGFILVDNTALIDASREEDSAMAQFLTRLTEMDCDLISTQAVMQEFTRGAKNITQSNKFIEFLQALNIESVNCNEKQFLSKKNALFRIGYCQTAKKASYADMNLALLAYIYRSTNIGILTSNYLDFPTNLFERTTFISYICADTIRTHAIFKVHSDAMLAKILKEYNQ